jgi:hypothetical protein
VAVIDVDVVALPIVDGESRGGENDGEAIAVRDEEDRCWGGGSVELRRGEGAIGEELEAASIARWEGEEEMAADEGDDEVGRDEDDGGGGECWMDEKGGGVFLEEDVVEDKPGMGEDEAV